MMIETKRLLLCRMSAEDTDQLLTIFSDPRVMASFDDQLFDRSMMERWVRRNLEHQDKLEEYFLKLVEMTLAPVGLPPKIRTTLDARLL